MPQLILGNIARVMVLVFDLNFVTFTILPKP